MNCVLLPLLGLGGRWWQLESICAPTSHIWLAGRGASICGLGKSRTCTVVESISKTTPATRSGDVAQRHFQRRHSDFNLTKFYLSLNRQIDKSLERRRVGPDEIKPWFVSRFNCLMTITAFVDMHN